MQKNVAHEIVGSPLRVKLSKLSKEQENPEEPNELENTHQEIMAQTPPINDQTPRFVKCVSHDVENGNIREYTWDKEKIFVHECLHDDVLMLQNVFEGKIISPLVYPLVFDWKSSQKEICLRSIQFYRDVQDNNSLYQSLSPDEKGYFLIGLRDLFIAACRGMLSQEEKKMLVNIVNLIDPRDNNIVYKTINNIDVSPYPTASHKMVRFLEEEKSGEDSNVLDECFVRNELGLLVGFVDPRDLSFHNFENIMNLDSLFNVGEDFPITNFQKHGDNEVYTFDLEDKRSLLLSLDKCGLYTQPLNKMSRGGERFIFASRVFGNNLTNSLQKHVSDKTVVNPDFQFVNYIFRYNKFKPGDKKFTSHFDTSYHDPAREHYSKYTLLLYLTPGTADPVLSIDNGKVKIDSIAAKNGCLKGVIFDQKYEHEGKSFIDSDKIFLRSELVYSYSNEELGFNADISKKFNIACYMTKQSVFNPELEKYASDCFNQAAQARIDLTKVKLTEDVLIYKNYLGIPFITNGYDYWFMKKTHLKTAAIVTILDYFGGKYTEIDMKEYGPGVICKIENLENVKDIFKCLQNYVCPHKEESIKEGSNEVKIQENIDTKEQEDTSDSDSLIDSLQSDLEEEFDRDQIDIKKLRSACHYGGYSSEDEEEEEDENEDDDNEEEDEEDKDDDDEEDEDYSSDDDDETDEDNPYRCHFCGGEHPMKSDVEDFLKRKKDWIGDLYSNKSEYAVFIFDKEIKIEKSRIQINKDTIVFEEEIPPVNFANCQFDFEYSRNDHIFDVEKISLRAFASIPPIHYTTHHEGHHLKIELFNNGFVREECLEFKRVVLKEKFFKTEDIPE